MNTHILDLAKEAEPPVDGILSRTIFQDDRIKAVVFGFGHVLALTGQQALLIQTTTQSHAGERVRKITGECQEKALAWLAAGCRIAVWGWHKVGHRWQLKEREIVAGDFPPA